MDEQVADKTPVRRTSIRRPSGWKVQGSWWTRPSKYGLRYMCPECGKKALGTTFRDNRHHHWKDCGRLADKVGGVA